MRECVARTRRPRTVRIDRVIHTALLQYSILLHTARQCCHKLIVRAHSSTQQPDQSRATDITWPPPNRYACIMRTYLSSQHTY